MTLLLLTAGSGFALEDLGVFFEDGPGDHEGVEDGGQRIAPGEDGFDAGGAQGAEVFADGDVAVGHVGEGSGDVGEEAEPADSGAGAGRLDGQSHAVGVKEPGEVDASGAAEGVESPGACVDVEQLVEAVAVVALVFDFDEAVVVEGFDEALGVVVDFGGVDGFDVGGGAVIKRVLPPRWAPARRASITSPRPPSRRRRSLR